MKLKLSKQWSKANDCLHCIHYRGRAATYCPIEECPCLRKMIEEKTLTYHAATSAILAPYPAMLMRTRLLPIKLLMDNGHKDRLFWLMKRSGTTTEDDPLRYLAVLYMLSSNEELYKRTHNCVGRGMVDFSRAKLYGIDTHDYSLFMAASCLYYGDETLPGEDMADRDLFDDRAFMVIVNAMLVSAFGPAALAFS